MDELIEDIIGLIDTHLKTPLGLKEVFYGDPLFLGKNSLPAMAVSPADTNITTVDTASDESVFRVTISVMVDGKDYLNKGSKKTHGHKHLVQMVEKRNADKSYTDDTVFTLCRKHIQVLEYVDYVRNLRSEYGVRQRGDSFTLEALVSFDVECEYQWREC